MLHGFAGTARHWDGVVALIDRERYSPLALELADAQPLGLAGAIELIAASAPERFVLCGYSMGGRVALNVALALPERVSRLVLVSASAGIDDPVARRDRLAADERLAGEIEAGTVEDFVTRWRGTPLFAADPDWVHELIAQDTRRLTREQIASTLRAFSPGLLPAVTDRLGELAMPAVVLAGSRDSGYCALGKRLARALPGGDYVGVTGAGHRVTLEAPAAVVSSFAG